MGSIVVLDVLGRGEEGRGWEGRGGEGRGGEGRGGEKRGGEGRGRGSTGDLILCAVWQGPAVGN